MNIVLASAFDVSCICFISSYLVQGEALFLVCRCVDMGRLLIGTVKSFNPVNGWGFLSSESARVGDIFVSDKTSPGVSAILEKGVVVRFRLARSKSASGTWEANDVMWFIKGLTVKVLLPGCICLFDLFSFWICFLLGYNFNLFMSWCGSSKLGPSGLYLYLHTDIRIRFGC